MMVEDGPTGEFLQANLSKVLPNFEAREGQRDMIWAIESALREKYDIVVEAGTGTGKTLAYLLPILASGRRAIVATATKQLQNQLVKHDLDVGVEATNAQVDIAVLKGRANYICLHRLKRTQAAAGMWSGQALSAVQEVALRSETGDVAEVEGVDERDAIWPSVTSTTENCIGSECAFFDECFVFRARRRALQAKIVVVNHHVLLADYRVQDRWDGASLLGEAGVIVIDEAHELADVATQFFGVTVSDRQFEKFSDDLSAAAADVGGSEGALLECAASTVLRASRCLWRDVGAGPPHELLDNKLCVRLNDAREDLVDVLHDQWRIINRLEAVRAFPAVRKASAVLEQLEYDLGIAIDHATENSPMVRWVERRSRSCAIVARPVDCGPYLARTLLAEPAVRIFTSATLAIGSDFRPFTDAVGLNPDTERLQLPGGFNYPQQALLYIPKHLPSPREPGREAAVAHEIKRLCRASGGGAFALFTSHRMTLEVHRRLEGELQMTCLLQGQASKQVLIDRFVQEQPAVLFATMGFWQGVDLPGDVLRMVILDKVPFPPPDDPLFAERAKRIERNGKSSFSQLSVPAAAIKLRQGFGRLIRSTSDRGVVAILDPRLARRSYGKRLVAALPPAKKTLAFHEVQDFFGLPQMSSTTA